MQRLLFVCLLVLPLGVSAGDLVEAFKNGTLLLDLRLRMEQVDQDGIDEDALATTLRTRLGYKTAAVKGWSLLVDFENIYAVTDNYNDTKNGEPRPVIADPEDTELNQAYLMWSQAKERNVKLGRQRLILHNARLVGNVGFRQNEQTYDGVVYTQNFSNNSKLTLGWLANANRIFGEGHPNDIRADFRMNTLLIDYTLAKTPVGTLALFGLGIEFEDLPNISHQDLGFRLNGAKEAGSVKWLWDLSYIQQSDYADAPSTVDADYHSVTVGAVMGSWTVKLAQETLGGDGIYAFQSQLATLHAFNGFADKFLGTPSTGLVDNFVQVLYKGDGWQLGAFYHDFEADIGGAAYGSELDMIGNYKINKRTSLVFRYADYASDGFATDTTKIWLWGQWKY